MPNNRFQRTANAAAEPERWAVIAKTGLPISQRGNRNCCNCNRGMVSSANLQALRDERIEYVLVCRGGERGVEDARQRDAIVQQLPGTIGQGGVRDELKAGACWYLTLTGAASEIDLKKVQTLTACTGQLSTARPIRPKR